MLNDKKAIGKINEETAALFVCDFQTYYLDKVEKVTNIIVNNKCLMDVCEELNIPIVMTKHDPNYYGDIIEELNPSKQKVFEKTLYSMYNKNVKEHIDQNYPKVDSIILTGLESHVCIVQTAQDLLEKGYIVHVIVDATSAINLEENKYALKRLKQMNVFLTTTEAIILQLIKDDTHHKSKQVIDIITKRTLPN